MLSACCAACAAAGEAAEDCAAVAACWPASDCCRCCIIEEASKSFRGSTAARMGLLLALRSSLEGGSSKEARPMTGVSTGRGMEEAWNTGSVKGSGLPASKIELRAVRGGDEAKLASCSLLVDATTPSRAPMMKSMACS